MQTISASPAKLPAWSAHDRHPAPAVRRPSVAIRAGMLPWVPFWLALGIGGWFALRDEPGRGFYAALAAIGCSCAAMIWFAGRHAASERLDWVSADRIRLAALAVVLVVLGAGLAGLRAHLIGAPVLDFRYYGPVEGRVVAIDRSARDRMRIVLDQLRMKDVAPSRTPARVRISLLSGGELPAAGQRVMLTAHLSPPAGPSEPGGFDFRRMAWFEQLGAVGYTRNPVLAVAPPEPGGIYALHRLRLSLAASITRQIGGQPGAVAAALMTGDRSGIEEATNDVMRASNLYHIISISGLHMSMLAGFVYAALRLVFATAQGLGAAPGWPMHKLAAGGALLASAAYLWLSGGGVATERAFIMVAVMLLAIIADRRAISLRTVAIAAIAILALNPEALTSPGFQMSFAATVALILVQGPWLQVQPHVPVWLRPVLLLLVSSLVASMATSPIAAAHFGRMTQYGLLANLLVVPVIGTLVMPGGVVAALLAPLGLAGPALWVVGLGTKWMLWIAEWIAGLDGAVFLLPAAPWTVLPLAGAGAMLLLLAPVQQLLASRRLTLVRRGVGAGLMALAVLVWARAERPLILVAAEGDAVGILTDAGRVPSKPRGGSFAVSNWLEADGDPADQAMAANRPLWSGEASARSAQLAYGDRKLTIHHLTGKNGLAALPQRCTKDAIVVIDQRVAPAPKGGCLLFDMRSLRQTGAVAFVASPSGLDTVPTDFPLAARLWSMSDRRVEFSDRLRRKRISKVE